MDKDKPEVCNICGASKTDETYLYLILPKKVDNESHKAELVCQYCWRKSRNE